MTSRACCAIASVALFISAPRLYAGGSGLNIVVVVNQTSTNSVQLGNYYCERRQVPPQNLLRISWSGSNVEWTVSDFTTYLLNPLAAMLAERQLTNQIDYVLLSMDIPYRVTASNGMNSTTAALFYRFKTNDCPSCQYPGCTLPEYTSNAYAASEGVFRETPPVSPGTNSWLAMMLTGSSPARAKATVDQAIISDGSSPTQTVFLVHNDFDPIRGIRYAEYNGSIFDNAVLAAEHVVWTNAPYPDIPGYQLGSQFGLSSFGLPSNLFAPGAIADNLTSFGGFIFDSLGQTTALDYLNAGSTASYGTIIEPCAYLEKFPSPQDYFYQARGFSIAECYYMSLKNPYEGLLLGEPLAAPFARVPAGAWSGLPTNAILTATTNLTMLLAARDGQHPVRQVDLFLDGVLVQTLTNITPAHSNVLAVTINEHAMSYTVPAGASLKSIAVGLADLLNQQANTNVTQALATAYGDRVELRLLDPAAPGSLVPVVVTNSIGSAATLTTFIAASRTNFLDSPAVGRRNFVVTNTPLSDSYLQLSVTKTNGLTVTLSVTNPPGNTSTPTLIQGLLNAINANADLLAADGIAASDFIDYTVYLSPSINGGEFNLYARTPGWPASQIQVSLSGSANFGISLLGTKYLDENVGDLQPRNHLYVAAGVTNLPLTFPFNTTTVADGYHELTAVAYEGSHVRSQRRLARSVIIQNSPLSAAFDCLVGDTNTALEATLQFSVAANTNNITRIELFSTGGSLAVATNLSSAIFDVAGSFLGIGLHPFYAAVTRADGERYRTRTKWIRIIGPEAPFPLNVAGPAPTLTWAATAGRSYSILATTNITGAFGIWASVTPTNCTGQWTETNAPAGQRFYRV